MTLILFALAGTFAVAPALGQSPPRCVPPRDGVRDCPENFYPRPSRTPSPAETKKIQKALEDALAAETAEAAAQQEFDKQTTAEGTLLWAKERQRHRTEKYNHYNEAMGLLIDAFGLRPPVDDFRDSPDLPPANKAIDRWRPHFSEQEVKDPKTGKWRPRKEDDKTWGSLGPPQAMTRENGRIAIFRASLQKELTNPLTREKKIVPMDLEEIAVRIYHETIHWVDHVADADKYPGNPSERDRPWSVVFSQESAAHTMTAAYATSLDRTSAATRLTTAAAIYASRAAVAKTMTADDLLLRHPEWIAEFRGGRPFDDEPPSEEDILQEELDAIRRQEAHVKSLIELRADINRAGRLAVAACRGEMITPEDLAAFHVSDALSLRPEIGDAPSDEGPAECESAVAYDLRLFLSKGWATAEYVNDWAARRREQGALKTMEDVAKECGFGFRRTRNTRRIIGFEELDPGGMSHYSFSISDRTPWDPEMMVGALVVARACLRVTKFEANMSQPGWTPICSERGLSIMARRWADPKQDAFLGKLSSSPSYHPDNCVRDINHGLRRATAKEFRSAVDIAHKNYHNNVKRNEEVWRQNLALWERQKRRQERERRGDPPQNGGDDGCANPNPDTGLIGCPQ